MKFLRAWVLAISFLFAGVASAAAPTATLAWDPYPQADITLFGITGYQVQRSIQPLGTTCSNLLSFQNLATTPVVNPNMSDSAQQLGKKQCYQVYSINSLGNSSPSNSAGKDFPLVVPPAPTGLVVQ